MNNENNIIDAIRQFGISCNEAKKAFQDFSNNIPPFTKEDILRIQMNPSLSLFSKYKLIKSMRKNMIK